MSHKNSSLSYVLEGRKEFFYSKVSNKVSHAKIENFSKYTLCLTGIHEPFGNALWQQGGTTMSSVEMHDALSSLKKTQLPFFWWGPPQMEKSNKPQEENLFFKDNNLSFFGDLTGVFLSHIIDMKISNQSSVEIKKVTTEDELRVFFNLVAQAFEMKPQAVMEMYQVSALPTWKGEEIQFLALKNKIPIGCVTLSVGSKTAGIWNFGVLKEHRHQGVGMALLKEAIVEAKARKYHDVMAILSQNTSVWSSLDFQEVCYFPLWIKK